MRETTYKLPAPIRLTIALVTDTHNTEPTLILNSLGKNQPDLICIAGDLLIGHRPKDNNLIVKSQENVMKLVTGCVGIAPTYISLGNHEWMVCSEDLEILTSTGAVVLDNRYVEAAGGKIVVGGFTPAVVSYFQEVREQGGAEERYPHRPHHDHLEDLDTDSAWLSEFEKAGDYKVLLCHHPEYWNLREPYLINRHINLVFSGHAHGGQMRILGRDLFAPGQGWFPKYTGGMYQGKYGALIVSRGLSNPASPVPRFGNPTEVVYVKLGE